MTERAVSLGISTRAGTSTMLSGERWGTAGASYYTTLALIKNV